MNPFQMALQIRHKLRTVVWPTGAGDLVFGARGAIVFAGTPTEEQIPPGFPWCLVGLGTGDPDEDHPELITQTFNLITGVDVAGDPMGEHSIIGGAVANLGKSVGRGIAEVGVRVRAAVQNLTGMDGAKILLTATAIDTPTAFGRGRHLTIDEHTLTALCTSDLHYAAPQVIAHDGTDWTWTGGHCSSRFDFLQYRLVRKTGFEPGTGPSDGTTVYTGTPATFTGVATNGNTYTVFCDYNARKGSTIDGSSGVEVGSYKVVE